MAGFRSAPFRLLRFPATLVAVLVAALLLAVAGAASHLFVDSAGNAALLREIDATAGRVPAFEIRRPGAVVPDVLDYRRQVVGRHLSLPGLDDPVLAGFGPLTQVSVPGRPEFEPARTLTRDGAFEHLRVVDGGEGEGVWIADRIARALQVGAGDTLRLYRGGEDVEVRVAAVYADLAFEPPDPYWTPFAGVIYPVTIGIGRSEEPPPSMIVMSYDDFLRVQPVLDDRAEFVWDFPLSGRPSLDEARRLSAQLTEIGGTLSDETTELGSTLASANYRAPVTTWVEQAERTVTAILTPIETISLAGRGVALAVVIAAGVYVIRRRRVEFTLLHARGVSPGRLGARVGVESVLPLALGTAAGAAAAVGLVSALGPGPFTRDAVREAAITAGIGAAVGVLALGVAAAATVRGLDAPEGRLRGVVGRVPWEVVVLTLAAAALYETVIRGGEPLVDAQGAVTIDRLLLLFPLLVLAGGAGVAVRFLRRLLPRLRGIRARSPSVYLSSRRLAGAPRAAGLLVTASALGLGMLAYAGLLTTSIRESADVKAHVAVGSDVAADLARATDEEPDLLVPSTSVRVVDEVGAAPGGTEMTLLAIRAETFGEAAFWDDGFGASLEDVLAGLAGEGAEVPVVVTGDSGDPTSLSLPGGSLPVRVVRRMEAFPGMPSVRPAVVVNVARLEAALDERGQTLASIGGRQEVWARGDRDEVLRALEANGNAWTFVRSVDEVRDTPAFQSLAWTFGFLEALGIGAGLIALVGLVLYLQTRQRAREISYALARRMGLSRGAHRRSVAIELAGMLVSAFVIGGVLALAAALLVYGKLDPLPSLPPDPVLRAPAAILGGAAAAIVVVAWVGARLVQRRADHANVAEVMRAA